MTNHLERLCLISAAGGAVWSFALMASRIAHIGEPQWVVGLIYVGLAVILPLGMRLLLDDRAGWPLKTAIGLQPLASLAALVGDQSMGATSVGAGVGAAVWNVPWLLVTLLMAGESIYRLLFRWPQSATTWAHTAALGFIAIGGVWMICAWTGFRPLEFDPIIVLLTAAHFHYAGFALPIAAGCTASRLPELASTLTVAGVIAGVPLVAIGITASHLQWGSAIELVATLVMATAATGVALLHMQRATDQSLAGWNQLAFMASGAVLVMSMVLAAMYGARNYVPLEWLTIPRMQAWHGTANALGFGLLGLLAWNADPMWRNKTTGADQRRALA